MSAFEECGICAMEMTEGTTTKTPCDHTFHTTCLKEWMLAHSFEIQRKNSYFYSEAQVAPECPYCRGGINYFETEPGEEAIPGVHLSIYKMHQDLMKQVKLTYVEFPGLPDSATIKALSTKKSKKAKKGVQCSGTTKKGNRCLLKVLTENGSAFCHLHKSADILEDPVPPLEP